MRCSFNVKKAYFCKNAKYSTGFQSMVNIYWSGITLPPLTVEVNIIERLATVWCQLLICLCKAYKADSEVQWWVKMKGFVEFCSIVIGRVLTRLCLYFAKASNSGKKIDKTYSCQVNMQRLNFCFRPFLKVSESLWSVEIKVLKLHWNCFFVPTATQVHKSCCISSHTSTASHTKNIQTVFFCSNSA